MENKKSKKIIIIICAILLIVALVCYGVYTTFTEKNDSPVYGENDRRCNVKEVIPADKLAEANSYLGTVEQLASGNVEVNCLTVDFVLTYKGEVTLDQAKEISTSITHKVDEIFGFDHYNAGDPYSMLFSERQLQPSEVGDRMYDIHITIFNEQNTYAAFGNKHYKVPTISYTDQNPKDQALVDKLHAEQATPAES